VAQIIKKGTHLEQKSRAAGKRSRMWWLLAGLCVVLLIFGVKLGQFLLTVIGAAGAAVFFVIGVTSGQENRIVQTGIDGETATANLIRQLPEGYFGFQNVTVSYQGKSSELDMVVVGRTGVFIIETKNHNGTIQGSFQEPQWIQYKTGRRGGSYSKELYNPVKQVGTHVYRLAHYLRDQGCNVHVDAMVFFTNPQATVQVYGTPGNIAVYAGQTGAELIFRQILSGNAELQPAVIRRVCQLLDQSC